MKTNYFKKPLSCILTGILLFNLPACTQQTPPQPSGTSSSTSSSKATESSSSAAAETPETAISETPSTSDGSGNLVIYFSATGNTKAVAQTIAEIASGDLYEIIAAQPYTSEDLIWSNKDSRVTVEHNDPTFRPTIAGELPDLSGYDTVFIGYPSWWGEAPNIVWTLMEGIDFAGKTVIPFCTSSSSGLGSSGETLKAMTSGATWLEGQRFRSGVDAAEVVAWVNELNV